MNLIVLMSTYNGEKYVSQQIDSIISQTINASVHLLIRDDGSTDSTKSILSDYEKKYNNIQVIKGENIGVAYSFMELIKIVGTYDYYAFSDQDDVWLDNKLECAIEKLEKIDSEALYFSNAMLVDEKLRKLNSYVYGTPPCYDFYSLSCFGCILGCTLVFNKKLIDVLRTSLDFHFVSMHDSYISQVCAAIGGKIVYDESAYILYRQHEDNVVGVPIGFSSKIVQKVRYFTKEQNVSIADQSYSILSNYKEYIPEDYKKWLGLIINYKKSFIKKLMLVCSRKIKSRTVLWAIIDRLTLLFEKR